MQNHLSNAKKRLLTAKSKMQKHLLNNKPPFQCKTKKTPYLLTAKYKMQKPSSLCKIKKKKNEKYLLTAK